MVVQLLSFAKYWIRSPSNPKFCERVVRVHSRRKLQLLLLLL